jgi:cobalt-zinc-cadmium efflux system membrane fusion protein
MKKFYILSFILATVFLIGCRKTTDKPDAADAENGKAPVYKTDTVHLLNMNQETRLNGNVDFDQNSIVKIYSLVSGRVSTVSADLGTHVVKGTELALVESPDIVNYINDYNQDILTLQVAKKNYENIQELYKAKFSSEIDLITAKRDFDKAKEESEKSSNLLKLYGGYKQGETGYMKIKSPITGFVVDKNVNPGMDIRSDNTNPLFTISDLKTVWVMANVYETDISRVYKGMNVVIKTLAYPDKEFPGHISNINSTIDHETKVLRVRIQIQNPEGMLKPDMFASIVLDHPLNRSALAVDPKAIVFDNNLYYVITVDANNKLARKEVKIISKTSHYSFVQGELKPGDRVVTEGSLLIYNSMNL